MRRSKNGWTKRLPATTKISTGRLESKKSPSIFVRRLCRRLLPSTRRSISSLPRRASQYSARQATWVDRGAKAQKARVVSQPSGNVCGDLGYSPRVHGRFLRSRSRSLSVSSRKRRGKPILRPLSVTKAPYSCGRSSSRRLTAPGFSCSRTIWLISSLSRECWIRRQWMSGSKSYKVDQANTDRPPEWPDNTNISDWVKRAFRGRFIDSLDHQLVRQLRGDL